MNFGNFLHFFERLLWKVAWKHALPNSHHNKKMFLLHLRTSTSVCSTWAASGRSARSGSTASRTWRQSFSSWPCPSTTRCSWRTKPPTACTRACACLTPSAITSGSSTHPLFCSWTRRICSRRRFSDQVWGESNCFHFRLRLFLSALSVFSGSKIRTFL